jgi:exodeoxyribonuclease VII large subunit
MVVHTSVKTPIAAAEWLIQRVAVQIDRVGELMSRLQRAVQGFVNAEKHRLVYYQQRLVGTVYQAVVKEKGKLVLLDKTVDLHSPERIYKMGYSLTTVNGKVLRQQKDVEVGDVLTTHLQDGVVTSIVK